MTLPLHITLWCVAIVAVTGTTAFVCAMGVLLSERWTDLRNARHARKASDRERTLTALKEFLSDSSAKDQRALTILCRLLDAAGGQVRIRRKDVESTARGRVVVTVEDRTGDLIFSRVFAPK